MSSLPLLSRRDALKLSAAGALGISLSGWLETLARHASAAAPPAGRRPKSCILLWMDGGPSHIDTFDPKPDAPAGVRGEFLPIATSAPGIQISDRFPRTARVMHHAAVLRGMSTPVNDHPGGRVYMHTGYRANEGGLTYPTLGSIVSHELGQPGTTLPNFVVTGALRNNRRLFLTSPGYVGSPYAPLVVNDVDKGVENLRAHAPAGRFDDRLSVLEALEGSFARTSQASAADAHRTTLSRAVQLMRSRAAQAFDLDREPAPARSAYGTSYFGRCCLLARRLVEVGVPFVEAYLPDWDTHDQRRAQAIKNFTMPQLDQAMANLVLDLKERGLLDTTLVIWMGEFGRTPAITARGGRNHFSRAWSTVLFGGGIKGGQVIGKTDRNGSTVVDRPIGVADFMATVCSVLGIDPDKRLMAPGNRPVRLTNRGKAVREVLG